SGASDAAELSVLVGAAAASVGSSLLQEVSTRPAARTATRPGRGRIFFMSDEAREHRPASRCNDDSISRADDSPASTTVSGASESAHPAALDVPTLVEVDVGQQPAVVG